MCILQHACNACIYMYNIICIAHTYTVLCMLCMHITSYVCVIQYVYTAICMLCMHIYVWNKFFSFNRVIYVMPQVDAWPGSGFFCPKFTLFDPGQNLKKAWTWADRNLTRVDFLSHFDAQISLLLVPSRRFLFLKSYYWKSMLVEKFKNNYWYIKIYAS
jgi:hypothetical protein